MKNGLAEIREGRKEGGREGGKDREIQSTMGKVRKVEGTHF